MELALRWNCQGEEKMDNGQLNTQWVLCIEEGTYQRKAGAAAAAAAAAATGGTAATVGV